MGYGHIAAPHAEAIQNFYEKHLNSYLNFHRPCAVSEETVNAEGKTKRVYRWYAMPWGNLRRLPGLAGYLKPDVTVEELDGTARAQTDTEAAMQMQAAKQKLFAGFPKQLRQVEVLADFYGADSAYWFSRAANYYGASGNRF